MRNRSKYMFIIKTNMKQERLLYITTLTLVIVLSLGIFIVKNDSAKSTFAATFDADLIPNTSNVFSIGQTLNQWKDALFGGNLTIGGNTVIGTSTIPTSAILTLESTTKGFLPPRMTTAQRDAITTLVEGLMIFNTDTIRREAYDGTSWNPLDGADADWVILGNDLYSSNSGNIGIGTASPVAKLHVAESSGFGTSLHTIDSDAGRIGIIEDNDITPVLQIAAENTGTSISHILLTGASTTVSSNKHWQIDAWGPSNSNRFSIGYNTSSANGWSLENVSEYITISKTGNVGIGATSPDELLHIDGVTDQGTLTLEGDSGGCISADDSDGAGSTYCTALNGSLICQNSIACN